MTSLPRPVHLFTDIEGSTRLWEEQGARMRHALAQHDALARAAVEHHRGRVVKTMGDGMHAVFAQPLDALAATLELQRALDDPAATDGMGLKVRCGLHLGADELRDDDYYGPDVNRAARIMAAGHGGQVLLSGALMHALGGALPPAAALLALGSVRLRDVPRPEALYQLVGEGLRREFPPLRGLAQTPHNLPQSLNRFVGRDAALGHLAELLASYRLLTLWGPGGIGKTRLALQLGRQLLGRFGDGVWFVELAQVNDPAQVAQAVAATLGIKESDGGTLAEALARHLSGREMLLLLDNCEHLLPAVATLVRPLLQAGQGLRVVATSRELLHLSGECAFPVPELALPDATLTDRQRLLQHEAVQLFVDRARLVDGDFELNAGNARAVVDICRRLDGIPLALELAAARLGSMSAPLMAERLARSLRLVTTHDASVAPRQRTLQLLIDWSWQLLDPAEQRLLARLSLFEGGFTLDAAEAVCADEGGGAADDLGALDVDAVLDLLGQLVDKSLLTVLAQRGRGAAARHADAPQRWRLLQTIRLFAAQRLAAAERDALSRRYVRCYADMADAAATQLDGPEQAAWHARIDADFGNLGAAHALALAEADGAMQSAALALAWRLGFALRDHCIHRGQLSAALRMVQGALAHPLAQPRDPQRARGLFDSGHLLYRLGRHDEARDALEQSLAIVRELGATQREASILQPLGHVYDRLNQPERALACYDEAIGIARRHGLALQLVSSLVCLAQRRQMEASFDVADALYGEALELAESQRAGVAAATIRLNLAMLALLQRRPTKALETVRAALPAVQESGSALLSVAVLDLACSLAVGFGVLPQALRWHRTAQALCRQTGLRREAVDEAFLAPALDQLRAAGHAAEIDELSELASDPSALADQADDALDPAARMLPEVAAWLQALTPMSIRSGLTTG